MNWAPERLFGTDGIRGRAGEPPLDSPTIVRLGAAVVRAIGTSGRQARLLMGRDTRESGEWIERELARGARAAGAQIESAGVLPTPAVAYLTRSRGYDAGLVISASHNPYEDNGIKVFSGGGEKFTDATERHIETIMGDRSWTPDIAPPATVPHVELLAAYLEHVRRVCPDIGSLGRMRVGVDCANGATTVVAPQLLRALGLDVAVFGSAPNGRNINLGCGSTHPESLASAVPRAGYRMGVAYDGDGDRAIFIDANGEIVDGDAVMLICAKYLCQRNRLRGNAIVATVMSNIGLELALREIGVELIRCPVGDKYVMEELLARNLSLGGEQSGHIIFPDFLYTGDGIITTLAVLQVMADTGRELGDLAADLKIFPQVLVNVPVRVKMDLKTVPEVRRAIANVDQRLQGAGRLLVRYSGTEPLLRVMIEGRDQNEIMAWADEIASVVRKHLGEIPN